VTVRSSRPNASNVKPVRAGVRTMKSVGVLRHTDVQMKSHVVKTTAACFAVLRLLRSIRRSVPGLVLQSLLSCLVLSGLDHGNTVLTGMSVHLLKCLQSVINSAARLVFSSSKLDHVTPLLRQLHWLSALWRIKYKLAVLAFKCLHGLAPSYLADELHHPAETEFRQRLRSDSSPALSVPRTRLSTYGDQAFPVAATQVWNSLPQHVTSASTLSTFCIRLKRHYYNFYYPLYFCSCLRSDFVILDMLIVFTYLLTSCQAAYSAQAVHDCSALPVWQSTTLFGRPHHVVWLSDHKSRSQIRHFWLCRSATYHVITW